VVMVVVLATAQGSSLPTHGCHRAGLLSGPWKTERMTCTSSTTTTWPTASLTSALHLQLCCRRHPGDRIVMGKKEVRLAGSRDPLAPRQRHCRWGHLDRYPLSWKREMTVVTKARLMSQTVPRVQALRTLCLPRPPGAEKKRSVRGWRHESARMAVQFHSTLPSRRMILARLVQATRSKAARRRRRRRTTVTTGVSALRQLHPSLASR
jgi:hypothetical protein